MNSEKKLEKMLDKIFAHNYRRPFSMHMIQRGPYPHFRTRLCDAEPYGNPLFETYKAKEVTCKKCLRIMKNDSYYSALLRESTI